MDPEPISKEGSVFGRIFDVLAAPGEVFQEIKDRDTNHANWLMPSILWLLTGCAIVLILFSNEAVSYEMRKQQEKTIQQQADKGQIPQAQADQAIAAMNQPWMATFMKVIMIVAVTLMAVVTPFFWGFIIWLLCVQVYKADVDYMKAVEVAGLTTTIYLLASLVIGLLSIVMGKMLFGFASFVFKDFDMTNRTHMIVAALNPFYLWFICVIAVSVSVLANVSVKRTLPWCLGIWVFMRAAFLSNQYTMGWAL